MAVKLFLCVALAVAGFVPGAMAQDGASPAPTPADGKPIRFDMEGAAIVEAGVFTGGAEKKLGEQIQVQYESTIHLLEQQKHLEEHRREVSRQGALFSREFFALSVTAADFSEKFHALVEKYPLAGEDRFSKKLIERGARIAGSKPEIPAEEPDQETVLPAFGLPSEGYRGIDLESHAEYQRLRQRLRQRLSEDESAP
jgi:hypothetical protein